MLESIHADVEKTTSLDIDPKPVDPAFMTRSREYSHPPPPGSVDGKSREISPPRQAHGHSGHQQQHQPQYASSANAWAEAFEHLQSTVHYNTTVLEDHRRMIAEFHDVLGRMHSEIGQLWAHVDRCREDIRSRPPPQPEQRPDAPDVDFLTVQLQNVATKANEVDGLKMQLEIMTRRLRRLEGHGSPAPQAADPASYAPPTSHPYPAKLAHATPAADRNIVHQTPGETRLPPPSALQAADNRPLTDYPPGSETRTLPGFRTLDAASAASAAWRSTALLSAQQQPGAPADPQAQTPRMESQQPTGWATVNIAQPGKRPSPHEPGQHFEGSASGSPKRQKLAALMPRASYGDSASTSGQSSFHQPSATPEHPSLSRFSSNETHASSFAPHLPATSTSAPNSLRIVQFPGSDGEGYMTSEARAAAMDANRRAGRGGAPRPRGRARKGTGATVSEHGDEPEWDRQSWAGSQIGANEAAHYHGPAGSPPESARRDLQQPPTSNAIFPDHVPGGQPPEKPTPASGAFADSSKKSRTKPVRNADGVLIRKDGRPDMRSVSSAMNLRKVHAKKEAERNNNGGKEDDDTPPSVAGVDGTSSHSPKPEIDGEREQERHRENMRKIFPYGIDAGRDKGVVEGKREVDGDREMVDRDGGDKKVDGFEEKRV